MPPLNKPTGYPILLNRLLKCFTLAIIIWYVVVCVVNYFYQRPLWNDEERVFDNIKWMNIQQIFGRDLLAYQVFPRLYLFLIQKVSMPFQFHLLSLRFLPLVCMLSAFFVWLKVSRYELKNKWEYLTFILSWPASAVLIYYSGELKQYSMDVLVASLFLLFIYYENALKDNRKSLYVLILLSLPALGLFSYIAFLFSLIVLYNLLVSAPGEKKEWRWALSYAAVLLAVGLISYAFDIRFRSAEAVTEGFKDYFISFNSFPEFLKTFGEGTNNLFSRWFVERPKILKKIGLFFVTFGFIYLFRGFFADIKKDRYRLRSLDTIAFVLFIELFLLGALKKYPFTIPRTSLFFCPIVLYLTVQGIASLKNFNRYLYGAIHVFYFLFLLFLTVALSRITFAGELTFRPILW